MTRANLKTSNPPPVEAVAVPVMSKPVFTSQEQILHLVQQNEALQRELASLRARLLQVQEQERTTLAKDLHGGPIQELSSLLFELNLLQQLAVDDTSKEMVDSIKENLKGAISHLRHYINELRPASLYHFGLQPAIRTYAETIQKDHGDLNVALFINNEERLASPQVELILFRVLQTAVQNVVKHAQAHNILVRLLCDEAQVRFEVEDDGVGFAVPSNWEDLAQQDKMGLYVMAQQVATIGGEMSLRSAPGQGTTLRVTVQTAQVEAR